MANCESAISYPSNQYGRALYSLVLSYFDDVYPLYTYMHVDDGCTVCIIIGRWVDTRLDCITRGVVRFPSI